MAIRPARPEAATVRPKFAPGGVISCKVAIVSDSNPPMPDPADAARRRRNKERIYVACQVVGWSVLLVMQLFFSGLLKDSESNSRGFDLIEVCGQLQAILTAFLISHSLRRYIDRWGWKDLGWAKLLPRLLGLAALASFVWVSSVHGWLFGVLRHPYPNSISPPVLYLAGLMNGTFIMTGWLFVYFIYHVFDRYNRSEIERLRLATVVKDAELRALKSQVNPHFMFNSLNSVRALIDEDPVRARAAVTQLANLLRYSLKSGATETVTFEDELEIVNDYLALEQVRHEERLRFRRDVAPDTLGCTLPPMLLQTLVENAVKYGISNLPSGGEIVLSARRDGEQLRIEVRNPGRLATTPGSAAVKRRSTGVGLRNANDRLRLLFGETADLWVEQSAPGEVTATVLVPQGRVSAPVPVTAVAGRPVRPREVTA